VFNAGVSVFYDCREFNGLSMVYYACDCRAFFQEALLKPLQQVFCWT